MSRLYNLLSGLEDFPLPQSVRLRFYRTHMVPLRQVLSRCLSCGQIQCAARSIAQPLRYSVTRDPLDFMIYNETTQKVIDDMRSLLKDPDLARLFENTFPNTLGNVKDHEKGALMTGYRHNRKIL